MKPVIVVIGTRAEAIKLIPVYLALKKTGIPVLLCATSQHSEMLSQVLNLFKVTPDFDLEVMKEDQDLFHITELVLNRTKTVYKKVNPSLVVVHGDTTTTLAASLSAFYLQIPIAHVEAGLRTGIITHPFPEEMNRKVVGQIATYSFTPTASATANMLSEGAKRENIFCTGNTVVDALYWIKEKIISNEIEVNPDLRFLVDDCDRRGAKKILLTAHRRESFGGGLLNIFHTVKEFALLHEDVCFFYPIHPNPNVLKAVEISGIREVPNILCLDAVPYKDLIYLLMSSDFVVTDSGGIQEEAVSLGRKVICLRDVTERHEGVWEGVEVLTGTDPVKIKNALERFYRTHNTKVMASTVYGDGRSCQRIVSILRDKLKFQEEAFDITNESVIPGEFL